MKLAHISILALVACGAPARRQSSTHIAIAPSAEASTVTVLEATARLNALIGQDVFTVRAVDSEAVRDGEVVIRAGTCWRPVAVACTTRSAHGVTIDLPLTPSALAIAHELGHAAGLHHHDEPGNLMFLEESHVNWSLDTVQIDHLRAL